MEAIRFLATTPPAVLVVSTIIDFAVLLYESNLAKVSSVSVR